MVRAPELPLSSPPGPLTPAPFRVVVRRQETPDVVTLELAPLPGWHEGAVPFGRFRHGQFNMLTAFGVGEVAISISSPPNAGTNLEHTIRRVGPVSGALCDAPVGAVVGVRGPFGTDWGIGRLLDGTAEGPRGAVVVAGGIGLAPLRGAICDLAEASCPLSVCVGARSPDQVLFASDLAAWDGMGVEVAVTVDVAAPGWKGAVGVVTDLVSAAPFDPDQVVALVCGPEIMMRFAARALMARGVGADRIRLSLERNMQCGVGFCGHCQLGPLLLCRDGPVVTYADVSGLLTMRER